MSNAALKDELSALGAAIAYGFEAGGEAIEHSIALAAALQTVAARGWSRDL